MKEANRIKHKYKKTKETRSGRGKERPEESESRQSVQLNTREMDGILMKDQEEGGTQVADGARETQVHGIHEFKP